MALEGAEEPREAEPEPKVFNYQPTSCLCKAEEGDLHAPWCDLRVFPGGLVGMTCGEAEEFNTRYREAHGFLVEGESDQALYDGDYRVFPCACGCGGRAAVTGMLWAMRPSATWWIGEHAPAGVSCRGKRYMERAVS